MKQHKYTDEEKAFMTAYVPGHTWKEIQKAFTERFKWEISISQINGCIRKYNLNTGRTGRFEKGHIPYNKGLKGVCHKGCEKGWFKKGNMPFNHKPTGSERIGKDGYIMVKTAEPNKWKPKHNVIWEEVNGKIPKDHVVIFLDQNKQNTDISNLQLISRRELLTMNRHNLFQPEKELTKTAVNIAKMVDARNNANQRLKKNNKQS